MITTYLIQYTRPGIPIIVSGSESNMEWAANFVDDLVEHHKCAIVSVSEKTYYPLIVKSWIIEDPLNNPRWPIISVDTTDPYNAHIDLGPFIRKQGLNEPGFLYKKRTRSIKMNSWVAEYTS